MDSLPVENSNFDPQLPNQAYIADTSFVLCFIFGYQVSIVWRVLYLDFAFLYLTLADLTLGDFYPCQFLICLDNNKFTDNPDQLLLSGDNDGGEEAEIPGAISRWGAVLF